MELSSTSGEVFITRWSWAPLIHCTKEPLPPVGQSILHYCISLTDYNQSGDNSTVRIQEADAQDYQVPNYTDAARTDSTSVYWSRDGTANNSDAATTYDSQIGSSTGYQQTRSSPQPQSDEPQAEAAAADVPEVAPPSYDDVSKIS